MAPSLKSFALGAAKADDEALATIYAKAGVKVADFSGDAMEKWRTIAEATAWKDYAARNAGCATLLKLAETVSA